MNKQLLYGHLSGVFTSCVWGLSFISINESLTVFGPGSLAVIRFSISLVFLGVLYGYQTKFETVKKKDMMYLALAGIIGISVYYLFENNGIKLTDPATASLILATIPVFTILIHALLSCTMLSRIKGMSLLFSLTGIVLVIGVNENAKPSSWFGLICIFGAVLSWIGFSFLTKQVSSRYQNTTITFFQTLFGTLFLVPSLWIEINVWEKISIPILGHVLFLAIFCSALGYCSYNYCISRLGVNQASMYINLMPVFTVIATLFLGVNMTLLQWIGCFLILISIMLLNKSESDKVFDLSIDKKIENDKVYNELIMRYDEGE